MAPISDSLRDSLTALSSQIAAAENFLQKQPGALEASVVLEDEEAWGNDAHLEVQRDTEGNCQMCVRYYRSCSDLKSLPPGRPLAEYPVSDRIKLSEYIPDLLDSVVAAEEIVATNAENATAMIEQALAKVKGE